MNSVWSYILVMAGVSFVLRALPLTLLRKPIQNRFIRSFLYYVPYVTLAVMTFPAILHATDSVLAGACAFVGGVILTYKGGSLLQTSLLCCVVVFLVELFA